MIYIILGKAHLLANWIHVIFIVGTVYIVVKLLKKALEKPHYIEVRVINKKKSVRSYANPRGLTAPSPVNLIIVSSESAKEEVFVVGERIYDKIEVGDSYRFLVKGEEIRAVEVIGRVI